MFGMFIRSKCLPFAYVIAPEDMRTGCPAAFQMPTRPKCVPVRIIPLVYLLLPPTGGFVRMTMPPQFCQLYIMEKCLIKGDYLPKCFFHNTMKCTYKRWNSIVHQTYFFNTYLISSISCSCCKWKNKWRSLSNKSGCNWLTNCVASCMRPFCMASRISMRSSNELSSTEGSRRPASIWNFSAASLKPSTSN